ncbi:hypothetical protein ACTWP5_28205 [Streptomyces sp. 4N509B]|uniref:hypothetical protein n=1 Tax=Streptomyces sp. 4N509B TaxID=3457413 RepID=UPI003FD49F93
MEFTLAAPTPVQLRDRDGWGRGLCWLCATAEAPVRWAGAVVYASSTHGRARVHMYACAPCLRQVIQLIDRQHQDKQEEGVRWR